MNGSIRRSALALFVAAAACGGSGGDSDRVGSSASSLDPAGGWTEVPGGGITSIADAAVTYHDHLYLFGVGSDHRHYDNVYDGASWTGWSEVPGGGTTVQPDTAAVYDDRILLFGIGIDDHRHYANVFDGRSWFGWHEVPGGGTTLVADAAVTYGDALYLFGIGIDDHRHYVDVLRGNAWSGWSEVPGGGTTLVSDGAAVYGDALYLFGIGIGDHQHYVNVLRGAAWSGWSAVPGGGTTMLPDGAASSGGKLYLFGVGIDDHGQYMNAFDGSAWSGWTCVAGANPTYVQDAAVAYRDQLFLFSVGADGHHDFTSTPQPCAAPHALRYNEVRQKSSHNAYAALDTRAMSIFDQLAFHHVRSLELDVHNDRYGSSFGIGDDFWVYHEPGGDENPTCDHLSTCLREIRAFHETQPNHEVITLWIEPKNPQWSDDHPPSLLDTDILKVFKYSDFYTPRDLLFSCDGAKTLREAVTRADCGWPTVDALRGKLILGILETDDTDSLESTVAAYVNRPEPLGFSAFGAQRAPNEAHDDPNAVIFNASQASKWARSGYVVRACCGASDTDLGDFDGWKAEGLQHLGMDLVNADAHPAFAVGSKHAWPFESIADPASTADHADDENVIRVVAAGGDIENGADSFAFASLANDDASSYWGAFVTDASDHVQGWAKGCIMAREDATADSPYFAVCRPADGHPARVQFRKNRHSGTSKPEFNLNPEKSATFLYLESFRRGALTCYVGHASDYASWESSSAVCFKNALRLQGLAASAGGGPNMRFLFGDVFRFDASGARHDYAASAFTTQAIGAGAAVIDFGDGSL